MSVSMPPFRALFLFVSVSVYSLTFARPAHAGGLDDLLERALSVDPRLAAAQADADAAAARVGGSRAALLPRLSASAGYTRNQYASEVTFPGADPVVITPVDQLDASVRLDVPLVDLAAWSTLSASAECRDATEASSAAAVGQALYGVAQAAWDLRSAELARTAAAASVAANAALLERARARRDAGTGAELDVLRATGDLARTQGALADADADLDAARRALRARTGVDALPADLVARPPPAGDAAAGALDRPEVVAARATLACRARTRDAARLGLAPSVGAFAQERVSNATGFSGQASSWSAGASLTWTPVDGGRRLAQSAEAAANVRAAEAALAQREQEAVDGLADANARLAAARVTLTAARDRQAAADAAATDARTRFEVGTGAAVDVSRSVDEALAAAIALARAEARHALAVETLRLAAGRPLRLASVNP